MLNSALSFNASLQAHRLLGLGYAVLLLCTGECDCRAHGTHEELLTELTEQIQQQPKNAELHFRRSYLYLEHGDWKACLIDLETAERLEPGKHACDLVRGPALALAGMPEAAKSTLDAFLETHPRNATALLERARVLKTLGQHPACLEDYRLALLNMPRPEPDLYHEVAEALHARGESDEARRVLQRGISQLGEVPALVLQALDIEVQTKHFDEALERVESMRRTAPRPEPWMAKRAELLSLAGREAEAQEAWKTLREHISQLPNLERGSHAMNTLAQRAAQHLRKTTDTTTASPVRQPPLSYTTAPVPLPPAAPSR